MSTLEPGLWAVVEASTHFNTTRRTFIHDIAPTGGLPWLDLYRLPGDLNRRACKWADFIDPDVIRPGVA